MKNLLKKIIQFLKIKKIPYPLTYVLWEDAQSSTTWENIEETKNRPHAICCSVGYLLSRNKESTVLTSDFGFDEFEGRIILQDCGNAIIIPTKNILKIAYINYNYDL
jgi:hypothetical protein